MDSGSYRSFNNLEQARINLIQLLNKKSPWKNYRTFACPGKRHSGIARWKPYWISGYRLCKLEGLSLPSWSGIPHRSYGRCHFAELPRQGRKRTCRSSRRQRQSMGRLLLWVLLPASRRPGRKYLLQLWMQLWRYLAHRRWKTGRQTSCTSRNHPKSRPLDLTR